MRGWIGRRCMGKRKAVYWILLALIMVTVTGCDYTLEEKREMKRYEKQGRENAKNYIREKYGIDAKITEINCEKYSSSPVPDFFPAPTGNVFVKMKYKGADFLIILLFINLCQFYTTDTLLFHTEPVKIYFANECCKCYLWGIVTYE